MQSRLVCKRRCQVTRAVQMRIRWPPRALDTRKSQTYNRIKGMCGAPVMVPKEAVKGREQR
jgi:hypothetical protein